MLLSGENDARSAIMTIHPGAGGTESQDWAEMLLRMYLRWAERNGFETVVTDRLEGEGAGIKSVTFEVNGENAYGLLQSEVGVHRLVRISPFDANARRHTSFARCSSIRRSTTKSRSISSRKICASTPSAPSGAGGQHVNRTDSADAHDAHSHRHRGAVPERAQPAQEPRQRDEAAARASCTSTSWTKKRVEERKLEDTKLGINFGSQIRSYVLAPYRMIKDHRTKLAIGDVDRVLDGDLEALIHAFLVCGRPARRRGRRRPDD